MQTSLYRLPAIILAITFCVMTAQAQTRQEADQIKFDETIKWLGMKLAYDYYNPESDVHWSNRFFYNKDENTVSFRSVSTNSPKTAIKKKVLDRTVRLDELDATSISLTKVDESRGRIVAGTSIQLSTIGNERVIQRSFNGSKSLKESSLEIPVPKLFEDSTQDMSQAISEQLILAIDLASKVYPSKDTLENINIILDVLNGTFKGSNESTRIYKRILHTAIESDEKIDEGFVEKEIIGYDESTHSFFRWTIQAHKTETSVLSIDTVDELTLFSKEKNYKLVIHGMHTFSIERNGTSVDFFRKSF